ncbi:hypothetical protein EO98_15535 [Methanosarcina sp. 2.H.T.1A.6]|nr:hypothetical protein EO94_06885 [Methanosarcina sp. 2.H.T.1A.3]KKG22911.1 hypothetical protein EO98_15535 [Methanosarcina sp. 2.H.T.1A.6]KKG24358.1 hypothetical protein EO96_14325 [Methanosarcina sp. 2.H.T.1A.8]KKG29155.1 hypothetical protein EO97_15670 [Methanosarcina sp. 2.H.T.1A.15]
MLNMKRYGKLLLSAYVMKKIKPGGSQKNGGVLNKYGKLVLGAYILEKLTSEKSQKELGLEIESEGVKLDEAGEGSSMNKFCKIMMGMLIGATVIYAFKKHAAKKCGYKIKVQ